MIERHLILLALLNTNLLELIPEMKKILFFVLSTVFCIFNAGGAVRDSSTTARGKTTNVITSKSPIRSITNRSATKKSVSARTNNTSISILKPRATTQSVVTRTPATRTSTTQSRKSEPTSAKLSARAATQTGNTTTETRTGTEYEQCKTAFFTCMDQFCELKNDNFKRCSCNDRVFKFQEMLKSYQDVSTQLTEFSENLDVVGLDKEQVIAMKTATEGENALSTDTSASKQLLQAIMNAITGESTTVGGKYQNLNSINIQSDILNSFDMMSSGQAIASYDGVKLYTAVFPQCKKAVQADCNNASLQRATNAYLMAIEQDCNTVETALYKQRKTLKAATYESSAMLDLARIENRQTRNSYDVATCIENLEATIQNENICGAEYHKCLDKGQFIDVTTGAPILGVHDFYKLGKLLTFQNNKNIQNQKLSQISSNKNFTEYFENKTKKFAKDVLNKCSDNADDVWQEYLDKALLDIYYAQQSKVTSIRNSCINLISSCYSQQYDAVTEALANLAGEENKVYATPATIELANQACESYVESCTQMFATDDTDGENVIQTYINDKQTTEIENACRLVVKKCFDDAGGTNYENFYSLQNGLITAGDALDWFTLYDITTEPEPELVSNCAKLLKSTEGCKNKGDEFMKRVFGGFDKKTVTGYELSIYGIPDTTMSTGFTPRKIRTNGVATEVYNKIIDILSTQCNQLHGYFVTAINGAEYGYDVYQHIYPNRLQCTVRTQGYTYDGSHQLPASLLEKTYFDTDTSPLSPNTLHYWYKFINYDVTNSETPPITIRISENICPAGYEQRIDTLSWGICSCWENGNYRSKNGTSPICLPVIPVPESAGIADGDTCTDIVLNYTPDDFDDEHSTNYIKTNKWCMMPTDFKSSKGQLCPRKHKKTFNSEDPDYPKEYCVAVDSAHPEGAIIEVIKDQQIHNGALNPEPDEEP